MPYTEILLVEDNPNDAEMTLRALKSHQVLNKIYHVPDGEQALDFIYCRGKFSTKEKSTRLRLIILDLKLPKIDGLEVLRTLKKDPETTQIPIVMMTSSKEEQDIINSYNLGVNSFVIKPVGFEEFSKAVSELGMYWMLLNETSDNK